MITKACARCALCLLLLGAMLAPGGHAAEESGVAILKAAGIHGGLVLHLGCGDGKLTAELRANDSYTVQGLDTDASNVARARQYVHGLGIYGGVSIAQWGGRDLLGYSDNLVNLVVVSDSASAPMSEVLRVLVPNGVAYVLKGDTWEKVVKPRPDNIDEWTHFLHDASNNAVAADDVVGPPRVLQWVDAPLWLRSHETPSGVEGQVAGGGRLFYFFDEGPIGIVDTRLPEKWALICRDAFNGKLLWKKPLSSWGWPEWASDKWDGADLTVLSGQRTNVPMENERRIVVDGNRVYTTLGFHEPVSILDAATGDVLQTIAGTGDARELLTSNGILVAYGSPEQAEANKRRGVESRTPAWLIAADGLTGEVLWRKDVPEIKESFLAIDGGRVVTEAGKELVCFGLSDGAEAWRRETPLSGAQTLVLAGGVVLLRSANEVTANDLVSGAPMWTKKIPKGSSAEVADLFVIDGLVWPGMTPVDENLEATGKSADALTVGLDLRTGEEKERISVANFRSPEHHHRCYRNKATERFIISGMEGAEFLDLKLDEHSQNNYLRGACKQGIMPCNGLLYVPPDQCFCQPGAKLLGYAAVAPEPAQPRGDVALSARLAKGPAYGDGTAGLLGLSGGGWTTFRHDAGRSGATPAAIPARLEEGWRTPIGGKLTAPVALNGTVYVAAVNAHTVYALEQATGEVQWHFLAGGRIDSPPTIYQGMLLFGSADGSVYCVRASDGALRWRFLAAPNERCIASFGQFESSWPVHGSVLVSDGVAYVAAGRSTYLDGGIRLWGLNPETGEVLYQTNTEGPFPDIEGEREVGFYIEGANSDVLVAEGGYIYMRQKKYTPQLEEVAGTVLAAKGEMDVGLHVFSTASLLDDSWYNRTFWMYAKQWPGFQLANQASKSGQILVHDDETTYAVNVFYRRNRHSPMFFPAQQGYLLFADANTNEPQIVGSDSAKEPVEWLPQSTYESSRGLAELDQPAFGNDKGVGYTRSEPPLWMTWLPVRMRAMVKTQDQLLVAGPPDVLDPADPLGALEGRKGGRLVSVSPKTGETLWEMTMDTEPNFDGMIAVPGSVLVSLSDGSLLCLKGTNDAQVASR